jgi:hypothetical protein
MELCDGLSFLIYKAPACRKSAEKEYVNIQRKTIDQNRVIMDVEI